MHSLKKSNGRMANMSEAERLVSVASGGALVAFGLSRRSRLGVALAVVGGGIAWRGMQGHSNLYERFGIQRFAGSGSAQNVVRGQGVHVERSVTVARPVEQVYDFWRQLENLPRFMRHLLEVRRVGDKVYHWAAKAPMGRTVEWIAEISDEHRPSFLTWRSLPGSDVENAGSVHFTRAPGDRGTEIRVVLAYKPPAGPLGAIVARLLGEEPAIQVRDDLARFKQLMETGEVTTARSYPARSRR